jgi:hypothetical protein
MKKIRKPTPLLIAWLLVAIGSFTIVIYVKLLFNQGIARFDGKIDLQGFAAFGDFIGGFVGSLWSMAAILFIYRTYQIQKSELKALSDYNKNQSFQTNFFHLIQLNRQSKQEFMFSNEQGERAFSAFRSNLNEVLNSESNTVQQRHAKVKCLFSIITNGYTQYPIHLIFETIKLIDDQNTQDKERYYRIFRSTFSINESIYIHNNIYSGWLLEEEIPKNLYKALPIIDRWTLFKFENGKSVFINKTEV